MFSVWVRDLRVRLEIAGEEPQLKLFEIQVQAGIWWKGPYSTAQGMDKGDDMEFKNHCPASETTTREKKQITKWGECLPTVH